MWGLTVCNDSFTSITICKLNVLMFGADLRQFSALRVKTYLPKLLLEITVALFYIQVPDEK